MNRTLLSGKIFGIIVTTQEDMTIRDLMHYTQENEKDVREAVDELVKAKKLKWNEPEEENKE